MGTYSYGEHLDMYGGPPEPGECYPDDPDAVRDEIEEQRRDADARGLCPTCAGRMMVQVSPEDGDDCPRCQL